MSATPQTVAEAAGRRPLAERLALNPDGVLEQIGRDYGVSTFEVVQALPEAHRTILPGDRFGEVMAEVTGWGEVLFIVHTPDIVLECVGTVPTGSHGRGYFNIHGDSPIGGHIKADRCQAIAFVARPFMGKESRSIQIFNLEGEAMFKIFVRRGPDREPPPEQTALFDALRARVSQV